MCLNACGLSGRLTNFTTKLCLWLQVEVLVLSGFGRFGCAYLREIIICVPATWGSIGAQLSIQRVNNKDSGFRGRPRPASGRVAPRSVSSVSEHGRRVSGSLGSRPTRECVRSAASLQSVSLSLTSLGPHAEPPGGAAHCQENEARTHMTTCISRHM